jgi:hypothetical protein
MKKYRIKLANDGNVVATGTSYECVKQMRIASVSSFHSLVSRCRSGKNKKYIAETIENRKGEATT